jgi:putative ABC transport system ATP-binding protein
MENPDLSVEISGLEKSYMEAGNKRDVLKDLNLEVNKGEIVLLLGRSGSGKSTLLNILSGIDKPDDGVIKIAGKDISNFTENELTGFRRKNIGFVFQFFNLIPTLSVKENLTLPISLNKIKDNGLSDWLLNEVGLMDRADTYPDRLSGGEQQRIAIARSLIHDPEIILADEPTGNLDEKTGNKVIELFEKLIKKKNKTLIMVTHNRELKKIADKIYTIRDKKT